MRFRSSDFPKPFPPTIRYAACFFLSDPFPSANKDEKRLSASLKESVISIVVALFFRQFINFSHLQDESENYFPIDIRFPDSRTRLRPNSSIVSNSLMSNVGPSLQSCKPPIEQESHKPIPHFMSRSRENCALVPRGLRKS